MRVPAASRRLPSRSSFLFLLPATLMLGCSAQSIRIDEVPPGRELEVVLDANATTVVPELPLKFYVDITNWSGRTLDLEGLEVELRAYPAREPDRTALRETWRYAWNDDVRLGPGKRVTLPIVPERVRGWKDGSSRSLEFPIDQLEPGEYWIRATVNGRHTSKPYRLRVVRPDLPGYGRALETRAEGGA